MNNMSFIEELDRYFDSTSSFDERPSVISKIYKKEISKNWENIGSPDFQVVARKIKQKLYRKDVFDYFENDKYAGYVATMLWGARGHVGDGGEKALDRCMKISSDVIRKTLSNVKLYLEQDKIKEAFNYLCKEGKIEGVGLSYLTKLLFFLKKKETSFYPLIYDTKLQYIHCALIKSQSDDNSFFNVNSFSVSDSMISGKISHLDWKPVDFYLDYLDQLNSLVEKYKDCRILKNVPDKERLGKMEMILFSDEIQNMAKKYLFGAKSRRANKQIKSNKEIEKINSQEALPSNISTEGWFNVETSYSHTPNGNGRQLVFINKKFKDTITEHYNAGEALEIQVENKIVKVKSKNPYKYASFRQREINNWAKQKENEGSIQNGQTFTIKARFVYNESN